MQWFNSKEADVTRKDFLIDVLQKCFQATFESLIKESGAVDVLSAMKPVMKSIYRNYFLETMRAMNISGDGPDTMLLVFQIGQAFAVPTNKMKGEITEFGAVGTVYQCPMQNSIPEICIYFSHFASEEVCQLLNPEYDCIWTHHLNAKDPFCRCLFKKKGQLLKDPEMLGRTIATLPELKIPEEQLYIMKLGGITMQLNGVTSAFIQLNGADKAKEILYPNAHRIGEKAGKQLKEMYPEASVNAETLGNLVFSLSKVLNQKGITNFASDNEFVTQVSDCSCQTFTPEFCGQIGSLFGGMVSGLNPSYEFTYDKLMTKGDKFCHWTIKRNAINLPSIGESSLEIIKRRFAIGEISKEQYLEMRALIE